MMTRGGGGDDVIYEQPLRRKKMSKLLTFLPKDLSDHLVFTHEVLVDHFGTPYMYTDHISKRGFPY